LEGDVEVDSGLTSNLASMTNGGSGSNSGMVDLDTSATGSMRVFNITTNELLITAQVIDSSGTPLGLSKQGGGTLTLTANNTYGGGTKISAGTLDIENGSGGSATGTGAVSLGAATLMTSGTARITGVVTATGTSGSSVIAVGSSPLGTTGSLTLNSGGMSATGLTLSFTIDGASASNSELILGSALSVTGGLTFDLSDLGSQTLMANTVYTLITGTGPITADTVTVNFSNSSYALNTTYGTDNGVLISGDTVTFEVQNVPEPFIETDLIAGGLLLLGFYGRRILAKMTKKRIIR
jgi:autotransporter-associated beta strand protein